ncbi:unnamed protein product [Brassicogethes aeneus]|uniref:PHTF1/2 N-terminal domain-containing protein n=1 Tax=Brassicogethes aeneus TaxID=1431903 RepID=A0A9P0FGD8_BRAAE|nr:unnamed protein product [Brassicogethes aeneus]
MGIDHIFNRYQKTIAAYDKQAWETQIEQKEQLIFGLNHIHTRSTKPNNDLIDLDLVRGSSFTKAKPQHGFLTIAKLATLRFMLLPIYGRWWIQETSINFFLLLLVLYLTQWISFIVFSLYNYYTDAQNISCMELFVPFMMMWILILIHSQIVATNYNIDPNVNKPWQYLQKRTLFRRHKQRNRPQLKLNVKLPHDDDGFESLTGNGSRTSEEETTPKLKKVLKVHDTITQKVHKMPSKLLKVEEMVKNGSKTSLDSQARVKKVTIDECNTHCIVENMKDVGGKDFGTDDDESDSKEPIQGQSGSKPIPLINVSNILDTEDDAVSSPEIRPKFMQFPANEWNSVTTNSDSSGVTDSEDTDDMHSAMEELEPSGILNTPSVKVSCIVWERGEIKKADLSMLDISSTIIGRVDAMPEGMDYFYVGMVIAATLALLPIICLLCNCNNNDLTNMHHPVSDIIKNISSHMISNNAFENYIQGGIETLDNMLMVLFGISAHERIIFFIVLFQRWILASMIFFLLSVAERTFNQRLHYAKMFSQLTSSRMAKKSDLPHFRLNKVRNIKTWLSVRSYLKKRGPQRSVDVIVSTSFVVCLLLLTFLCFELLKETINLSQYYMEALIWCLGLGIFLLRFMTLGTKINKKYRNLSVLITEQINLHLKIEQKPHKKEELNVANNVLKLAIDLLKELDSPFKISGLSANPILYNVTKLIILSALSGVLSEMLGFKLKLHKIKLK